MAVDRKSKARNQVVQFHSNAYAPPASERPTDRPTVRPTVRQSDRPTDRPPDCPSVRPSDRRWNTLEATAPMGPLDEDAKFTPPYVYMNNGKQYVYIY